MGGKRRPGSILAREHERLERDLSLDALVWSGGCEARAARVLGITRNTLRRIRRQLGELPAGEGYAFKTAPSGAPWVPEKAPAGDHQGRVP